MHITIVAGARPNFMKVAPIIDAIKKRKNEGVNINYSIVHTGQHYDKALSDTFFEELNIPLPNARSLKLVQEPKPLKLQLLW